MVDAVGATTKLQRILLSWDYWDLVRKSNEGGGPFETLRTVPNSFADMKEYKEVFEPLILEECCAQILRGVEEGEVLEPHPCVMSTSEQKDDFLFARLALEQEASRGYGDNDLVLLCKENPWNDEEEGSRGAAHELHALGYCEGHEGEQSIRVKFMLTDDSQLGSTAGLNRVRAMRAGLTAPGSCWWLLKLANMSTISREWVALQHAHVCPFIDTLLACKPRSAPSNKHMDIPPGMAGTMESQCNTSQMDALRAGLDGTPVVLIQGPPGTGKTRTILNLLSVVMHSAQKGSLELMKEVPQEREGAPLSQLGEEERARLWLAQAPWVGGDLCVRDAITPYDPPASANDAVYGLTVGWQRAPIRVGRDSGPKAHVLVCAPSNSALDEIVYRIIKSGLMDKDGQMYAPSVVRIGVNPHHSVRSVALDAIVDARLGVENDRKGGNVSRVERDRMRMAILDEASIVCSTLSFAGSSIFYRLSRKFDVVVIDEAAQAVEPSTLVPLIMGCKQVYLVGDPVQLPATVISSRAQDAAYDCSMFKRLQGGGYPVKMLDTQYRMHPDISRFPSRQFYGGGLLDGESVHTDTVSPWHSQRCFGPFAFYDVAGKESVPPNGASIQNKAEANMVLCIYRELVHKFPALRKSASVAVISPYKAQVKLLREAFTAALGEEQARLVDVNTIDGFQGREKDICIFSCVRSLRKGKKGGGIGFVADERRINVGLTRARCSLIVVGNARALQYNGHWASLIHDAMTRSSFYRPKAPFADWMTCAAEGKAAPVEPSEAELAALDKARAKLGASHTKEQGDEEVEEEVAEQLAQELHEGELAGDDEGEIAKLGRAAPADDGAGDAAGTNGSAGAPASGRGKRKAAGAAAAAPAAGGDAKAADAGGAAASKRKRK
uniref:Helicase ATP-binding domain-containing protein n=1 Tax=Chlamydomonas leiostraca TaxID=1034604 RepID=A0A7S0WSL5_9CHLO|eukprot:CAMPEP_0202880080 /NCGR_PEP_ID=MMETSP1391-20130828/34551_1 /ASSEMBLY_ACC=CAM_ASM_000867 /TAXON_ID=1034604 /ORGANISM="Chlamydomonas leiostraca, Strain SAG 11-49" /LENGTH=892 /DNA_ID=CAMNT_0049562529 /DNA_START=21 /DNA_END=2699 /DNA_ORIENTATION=-